MGVLLVVLVLPMLISRDLTVVARYSRASVFMMLFLAGVIAALAGLAVAKVRGGGGWALGAAAGGCWGCQCCVPCSALLLRFERWQVQQLCSAPLG